MLALEQIDPKSAPPVDGYADGTVFQTDEWLAFVEETQGATPVVALLRDGHTVVGRFTGLTFKRMGLRFLGSPFPGWSTAYMGFNLDPETPRSEALAALDSFAFRQLGCVHYEVMDRGLDPTCSEVQRYHHRMFRGFEIDLTQSEDQLYAAMDRNRHRSIRQSQRRGASIEEATDEAFASDFYSQLLDVFGRQGLLPTYDCIRVQTLMHHLQPTGRLLLLRAREADRRCTSTGIFIGFNGCMYSWGAASSGSLEVRHSNELLLWHAIRYWKARGMTTFDMGGGGDYKRRYGGHEIEVPWVRKSRYGGMESMRQVARRAYSFKQRLGAAGS